MILLYNKKKYNLTARIAYCTDLSIPEIEIFLVDSYENSLTFSITIDQYNDTKLFKSIIKDSIQKRDKKQYMIKHTLKNAVDKINSKRSTMNLSDN
jgi:hypothetical protein